MKFLVPNYSCSRTPDWGAQHPDHRSLSSTEFVEPPPEQNSWVRHWVLSPWGKLKASQFHSRRGASYSCLAQDVQTASGNQPTIQSVPGHLLPR